MFDLHAVCGLCGAELADLAALQAHAAAHAAADAAAAVKPLQPLNLKAVIYGIHEAFYRRHSNPRKCGHYAKQPCAACGQPHPCPAVN